jgi:RNA polymerase sigma-70 factor (ECF subfamily)
VVDGELVLLEDQDRRLWDGARIDEGQAALDRAWRMGRHGSYQLQAAIAAAHDRAPSYAATEWPTIVDLYTRLAAVDPSPVVRLNLAVAEAMMLGPEVGLERIAPLEGTLVTYPYLHAARADLLRRLGRDDEAREAYGRALVLTGNAAERRFIERHLESLSIH